MDRVFGNFVTGRGAWGLLIVRLVFGLALMIHGWPKIQHPFDWPGPQVPSFLLALAALAEFGGGLAMILGLLTPLAAFGIICNFIVATYVARGPGNPFVAPKPGDKSYEAAAEFLAIGFLMLLTGPGTLSLDAMLFGKGRREESPSDVSRFGVYQTGDKP